MGRKKALEEKKVAYNGRLQQYKIDALGGTKEVNRKAYKHLTESYNQLTPIPLTEEWLLKFGFQQDDSHYFELSLQKNDNVITDLWCRSESGLKINLSIYDRVIIEETCFELSHIKYVHQLQNLYFALTGEELTIKQ